MQQVAEVHAVRYKHAGNEKLHSSKIQFIFMSYTNAVEIEKKTVCIAVLKKFG